ncbi:MAG: hypothetical protein E7232_04355 [Lachnospiraceae bacterium]|jgi:hypothetical protein|nr:hypothetical protein [Lachnospiraceae bacterium]
MIYILLHKDIPVCVFELETEVVSGVINLKTADHLPLPLKRIVHYQTEFVRYVQDSQLILNEEGCLLVDIWLNNRIIPANRKNRQKYADFPKNALTWMLVYLSTENSVKSSLKIQSLLF